MSEQTITINGTVYDMVTGMPVMRADEPQAAEAAPATTHQAARPSHEIHQHTQKSHTLNRKIVQKHAPVIAHPAHQHVTRSPHITKFAPNPSGTPTRPARVISDIAPTTHPLVQKAHAQQQARAAVRPAHVPVHPAVQATAPAPAAPKPSQVIKQEAIAEALEKAPSHHANTKQHKPAKATKHSRTMSIVAASVALLMLGGYFTYLNMPSLSVRVAAAQAGVNAVYPGYHPDGYTLKGPVAYSEGQVRLKFASNGSSKSFTVAQTKTNWDPTAVKENYADSKWGSDNVDTYTQDGLTIYAYEGNAVWVNDGVLYTISGDAPLSSGQIRHLAASL